MKKIYYLLCLFMLIAVTMSAQTRIYAPTLNAPVNESRGNAPDVVLDWLAVTGITLDITYEAQLSLTPDFTDAITFPRTDLTSVQTTDLTFGALYFWRVRAFDGANPSEWSETWSFRVVWTVSLTSIPSDGSMVYANPTIQWREITGISKYQFQLDTSYAWHEGVSGVSSALNGTFVVNEGDIWAVGDGGVVLHSDGTAWTTMESGVTEDLNDVYFVDASHGYAVGAAGTIIFYDGATWAAQDSPNDKELFGVSFADATAGFAVGASGTIFKFSDNVWTEETSGISSDIYDVSVVSETNVWACGKSNKVLHYDGSGWMDQEVGTKDLFGISFQDENNGWVVGKLGTIFQYDGAAWVQQYVSSSATTFNKDLMGVSVKDFKGYAVGVSGNLIAFDGVWSLVTSGTTNALNAVHAYGDDFGMIVGASGTVLEKTDAGFNSPALKTFTLGSTFTTTDLEDLRFGQTYYYRMRALHGADTSAWSQVKSMTTFPTVDPVSPENGAEVDMAILLEWTKYEGIVDFVIEIDNNESFSSPQVFYSDSTSIGLVSNYFGAESFWRVAAEHAFDRSDWSTPYSLVTKDVVNLTSPADGQIDVSSCPKFVWEPILGSHGYEVWVSKSSDFIDPMVSNVTTSFLQCYSTMERNTVYFWKVRGTTAVDTSSWSVARSFTTEGYIGINEYLNGDAILIYPNPNNGEFTVILESYSTDEYIVKIADLAGRVVYNETQTFVPGENAVKISAPSLEQGMYSLIISIGDESITKKILVN